MAQQMTAAGTEATPKQRLERILVVDDEIGICQAILVALQTEGFIGVAAHKLDDAWDLLSRDHFDLMLADIRMPGGSGMDLLRRARTAIPDIAVIMVTAVHERHLAVQALHDGAYGYVTKPFSINELLINVANALHRRHLEAISRLRRDELEAIIREQTRNLQRSHEEITLRLIAAQSVRHDETGAHVRRIGLYAEAMGKEMHLNQEQCEILRLAAPMHDIGKIGIPDAVLLKPGALSTEERELMKQHTIIGARILEGSVLPLLSTARDIALSHHERWDGTGYPKGLAGKDIALESRIVAILDVYDALVHHRVYRPAIKESIALEMIQAERGRHFDPEIHDVFLATLPTLRAIRQEVQESDLPPN